VSRYWWLHVNAVDGTGTLLADANVHHAPTPRPEYADALHGPGPAVDDIYFANSTTWPVSARADRSCTERSRRVGRLGRILNNSYVATGSAVVDLTTYQPDARPPPS